MHADPTTPSGALGSVLAIVVGAGAGQRMGGQPKALTEVLGRPLVSYSLEALDAWGEVGHVVAVLPADWLADGRRLVESVVRSKPVMVCAGGATRRASVRAGLAAADTGAPLTLVHDAARPNLTREMLSRGIAAGRATGAAVAAIPAQDTVKEVGPGGAVLRTLDRARLYQAQTPQVFATAALLRAHDEAPPALELDDASLLEAIGHPVHVFEGDPLNIKVTTQSDLALIEAALRARASGPARAAEPA